MKKKQIYHFFLNTVYVAQSCGHCFHSVLVSVCPRKN